MIQITASMVMELRKTTGAGMMDCKVALTENDGDFKKALEFLQIRKKATAAKKAGRIAAEEVCIIIKFLPFTKGKKRAVYNTPKCP